MPSLRVLPLLALTAGIPGQQYEWRRTEQLAFAQNSGVMSFDSWRHRPVCLLGPVTWECDGSTWRQRGMYPAPLLFQPGFVFDPVRGTTWLFGGGTGGPYNAQTWRWDGVVWTQVFPAVSPPARWFSPLVYDGARQMIVMYGGEGNGGWLSDTWEFDGVTWTQHLPATTPTARLRHTLAYDAARSVTVLFGGLPQSGNTALNETWEWNGVNWTQRFPAQSPPARRNHGMVYDPVRARTVVFGGYGGPVELTDTWEYDGVTWQQVAIGLPAPPMQVTQPMVFDPDRAVVLCIGSHFGANRTWAFDGSSWRILLREQTPGLSEQHAMAYDLQRGETVLFGQGSPFSSVNPPVRTWVNRGGAWTQRFPATSPPNLQQSAAAFDPAGSGIVLFGGRTGVAVTNVTWRWNGADWRLLQPAASPPSRIATAMAADLARQRVVLFGGDSGAGVWLADTWEWDGANWLQRTPSSAPPPRAGHAMAWDAVRARTVMFGGGAALSPPTLGDHWEWDGSAWVQVTVTLPPSRGQHSMVFDTASSRVLMLGGVVVTMPAFPAFRNDAWSWDGSQWQLLMPLTTPPPPRRTTTAVHDWMLQRTLMFGGDTDFDTWLLGPVSAAQTSAYGNGCPGSFGLPEVHAVGEPFVGNAWFGIQISALPPGAFALLGVSTNQAGVALGGGCTLLTGQPAWLTGVADARGAVDVAIPIPNLAWLHRFSVFAQGVALDSRGAFAGVASLSGGLRVTVD